MTGVSLELVYVAISFVAIFIDLVVAVHCLVEKKNTAKWLAATCFGAATVQAMYLTIVFTTDRFLASVFSSLYFSSITFCVLSIFIFFRKYSGDRKDKLHKVILTAVIAYYVFELVCVIINPFKEIFVNLVPNGQLIAQYSYHQLPLFRLHLLVIYLLLIATIVNIYRGVKRVPSSYRRPFYYSIGMIVAVVIINAIYMYFPQVFGQFALDYSLWGYSVAVMLIYSNCYRYTANGMKPFYNTWIVENVNQGVALFDYEDKLTVTNKKLKTLLPEVQFSDEMSIKQFADAIGVELKPERKEEDYSLQFYVAKSGKNRTIRLDHRCLRESNSEIVGQLLVFTDVVGEVDVLTGFYNWANFKSFLEENADIFNDGAVVAVCDINGLGEINTEYGRPTGDKAITILANTIRKNFPVECYFVRGQEASLIVITYDIGIDEVNRLVDKVQAEITKQTEVDCFINIQSAVTAKNSDNETILDTVKMAFKSMQNKKLLDSESPKSELVSSLIKALEEVDQGTEEHVRRTQAMGYELGKRLGLSDVQLSDLALLCILHDIGKIGIPLNILKKPGKLDDAEWRMMRTHTEKGYQIAMSSRELSDIADMILHHHECWDGRGYPDGLRKESIPLLSRIISVVDSYDAMVNDRPYRKGMAPEQALAELKRCAGTQFDPVIVNEFVAMIPNVDTEAAADHDIIKPHQAQIIEVNETVEDADISNVHTVEFCRYVLDEKQHIVEINDVFEPLTGYSMADIKELQLTQMDLLPEEDKTGYFMLVNESLAKYPIAYFEHRIKCKNGIIKRVLCMGRVYYDSAALETRSEIIVIDSTSTHAMKVMLSEEHSKAQTRLQRWEDKYRTDSLTGILNHEAFRSDVDMKLIEGKNKVMFLMMDVDKFKNYNDTYGHKAGDEFLIMIAQTLAGSLRDGDLACRMGGDEFACALIYPPTTSDEAMIGRAKQIYEKLNYTLSADNTGTSLSMGVVISTPEYNTFNALYETADRALYDAKESGRARMKVAE